MTKRNRPVKLCRGCDQERPLEDFGVNRTASDGLQWRCRECSAIQRRAQRARRPEHYRAQRRRQYHKDPTRERARGNERQREWREANPEANREQVKAWRAANPEAEREQSRVKMARRRAAGQPEWGSTKWQAERLIVLERDDGVCGICSDDVDPLDFTIDHVVAIAVGGVHELDNLQLAHSLCNNRKYTSVAA